MKSVDKDKEEEVNALSIRSVSIIKIKAIKIKLEIVKEEGGQQSAKVPNIENITTICKHKRGEGGMYIEEIREWQCKTKWKSAFWGNISFPCSIPYVLIYSYFQGISILFRYVDGHRVTRTGCNVN